MPGQQAATPYDLLRQPAAGAPNAERAWESRVPLQGCLHPRSSASVHRQQRCLGTEAGGCRLQLGGSAPAPRRAQKRSGSGPASLATTWSREKGGGRGGHRHRSKDSAPCPGRGCPHQAARCDLGSGCATRKTHTHTLPSCVCPPACRLTPAALTTEPSASTRVASRIPSQAGPKARERREMPPLRTRPIPTTLHTPSGAASLEPRQAHAASRAKQMGSCQLPAGQKRPPMTGCFAANASAPSRTPLTATRLSQGG